MMPAPLGVDQVFTSGRPTESRHLPRPGLRSGPAAYLGPWSLVGGSRCSRSPGRSCWQRRRAEIRRDAASPDERPRQPPLARSSSVNHKRNPAGRCRAGSPWIHHGLRPTRCQTPMVELGRRVVYLAHLGLGRQGECILEAESDHRLSWNG
jgi:hypothetical protein